MTASNSNNIIELLENFLKILKEEQVFDRSSDYSIIIHLKDSQVNNSLVILCQ